MKVGGESQQVDARTELWKLRLPTASSPLGRIQPPSLAATMKLSWGLLASSLYCAAAAAKNGHVFTFDGTSNHAAPASSPIDAETARLILAQRLGLSRFHSIKDADAEAIKNINTYGGRQQQLFGERADTSRAQLLVWLEDAEESLVTSGCPFCVDYERGLTRV